MYNFYLDELPSIGLKLAQSQRNNLELLVNSNCSYDKRITFFSLETNKYNIKTRPIWRLLFKLPMYMDCQRSQKNALQLENTIINIQAMLKLIKKKNYSCWLFRAFIRNYRCFNKPRIGYKGLYRVITKDQKPISFKIFW